MYGAIIGDIAGSIYEYEEFKGKKNYEERIKIYKEELITKDCFYSDDTILTIAILDSIINGVSYESNLKKYANTFNIPMNQVNSFNTYFSVGFTKWLRGENLGNSIGNGSSMRVSPTGFLFDKPAYVLEEARKSAIPSHNSFDSIRGSQAVAFAIYLARIGYNGERIKFFIERNFNYKLDFNLGDLQKNYKFSSLTKESVPEALYIALTSNDFESTIRNTISIGGDTDTIACISGSIAEALYGIPSYLKEEANEILPENFKNTLKEGYQRIR